MLSALVSLCLGLAQQSAINHSKVTYPVFETDKIPISELRARRQAIKTALGPNSVMVVFTNPEQFRNNDCDFRFRGDSDFLYLTGFEEPDAALILAPSGIEVDGKKVTEVMFVNEPDPVSETWLGYRMGSRDAKTLLGLDTVLSNHPDSFRRVLHTLDRNETLSVWQPWLPKNQGETLSKLKEILAEWRSSHPDWPTPPGTLGDLTAKLRVKKSANEIRLLRRAAQASTAGHREVMRSVMPGMREYQLQGIIEYLLTRNGCESVGYNSIVGSGPNSCILHYEDDRRLIQNGDIICMDAAGEYHGYSADVTRSFPANGKFSPAQRQIYQIVLDAQTAGIAQCKPGNSFGAPEQAAVRVLIAELKGIGLIKHDDELGLYLPHGVSHYIGLDVHDSEGDDTLRPGYALTVEPGLYIKAGSPCDPKYWNIGIRIEDDILVTERGPENLSAGAPRQIKDIEAMMRQSGIGKHPAGE